MKLIKLLILANFGISFCLHASNVNLQTATEVAKNFYFVNNGISLSDNEVFIENVITDGNDTTYYIFNYAGLKGFIILSADDATVPVIGYSFIGKYESMNVPSQLEWLLSEYHNQIKSIKFQNKIKPLPTNTEWTNLLNKVSYSNKTTTAVSPLTTSTWNQSPYYNDMCPYDSTAKKRTYAGCVAIAMSQVMKYWNFPDQGSGSRSYSLTKYGTQSANFANTTYKWSSMPNSIGSANSEVAQLIYHVGVSIKMDYSTTSSSAYPTDVPTSLKTYFKYASTAKYVYKSSYTDSTWSALISNELNSKRVVIISGQDTAKKAGHAFVCDGYDANKMFHINWGWGGYKDGYFYLNNLNTGYYVWSSSIGAVIGMEPGPNYCSGTKTVTDSTGTINDGSGTSNYLDNTDCKWLISNTSAKSITLTFKSFSTEKNYDYVYVYDGSSASSTLLGKYSGTTLPSAVTSTGNSLFINFKSDASTTSSGWEATYVMTFPSTTTTSGCSGTTTLTTSTGTFNDGSGTSNYTDDAACKWLIQPTGASTVTLSFSSFDLESGYDFVKVYDGTTTSSTLLGSYSGSTIPSAISSTGSSMLVYFTSDYMETGAGFSASYKGNTSSTSSSYASLPYSTSFESGLDSYWKTQSSVSSGRIQVTSSNSPYDGSKQLTMDVSTNGTYSTNEAWLKLDLSGVTQCYMTLYTKSFSEDTHTSDGFYFSNNGGTSFTKVSSYSTSSTKWTLVKLDIDQLASSAGLSLSSTFVIKFQQYDNYGISSDGMGYDKINVVSGSLKDEVSDIIELNTNENLAVKIAPNPFSDITNIHFILAYTSGVNIEIYNSLGQKIKTLLNETKNSGEYILEWNGTNDNGNKLPIGLYTCIVKTERGMSSSTIILSR